MELYGIVGAADKKTTPSGRELFEVVLYWLDYKVKDKDGNDKNKPVQVAFWDNIELLPERIRKGNRLRITVDRLVENVTINSQGQPVCYLNANGLAYVYDNRGTGTGTSNEGANNNRSNGNNQNQGSNRTQSGNNNGYRNGGQQSNNQGNQGGNSNQNQGSNQSQGRNQGQNQSNQNSQSGNSSGGNSANPAKDQINDIESFLSSI